MPNQNQWSVFKRLLTYLKPYKFLTFLALTFLLSTTVIKSIIPLVASYFIDHYLHDMNQAASMILIGYYGLYLLQTLVQYLGNLFFARVSYSIVRDIRRDAFANMEKLGMSYFDKTPAGSIVSRLTNDTETISEMFSGILSSFISAIFIFVTTLYTMMILDIRLTGLIVLFLPLIVLLVNLYRKKSVVIIEKTRALLSDINAKLSESIEGIRIIQAFNQEKRLKKEFDDINDIEKYTKCDLLVSREDAVKLEPGEYFICDLIGLDVITDEGKHLGVLKDVLETGANNVYEVEADNGESYLIPVIDQCILDHNLDKKTITVHILPGLLDINK